MKPDKYILDEQKHEVADELSEIAEQAHELAKELGLDPFPVRYWVVDNEEMYQLIAYQGYQKRYPHWRWGETYSKQKAKGRVGAGKALEIVNNNNPAHAFLQQSNNRIDQKAVITHVEAHADFFKNNKWFERSDTVGIITSQAERIEEIIEREDLSRSEVERWIDNVLSIQDTINQYDDMEAAFEHLSFDQDVTEEEREERLEEKIEELGLTKEVYESQFTEEWIQEQAKKAGDGNSYIQDVVGFLAVNGMQYDEDNGRAVEFEDWQREVIEILREEAHLFAPQKMTRIMNEGWASFWESIMMASENFASEEEIIQYADSQSLVLNDSDGTNPYKLGVELWKHIENTANRKEVVEKLLRVKGINWKNFHDQVSFDKVLSLLDHPNSDDPRIRNFSLVRPRNRGFLSDISKQELEEIDRYLFDTNRYESIEEAINDVDYHAGWDKLFAVRESHNDITFVDTFLDQEFADRYEYFAYEYSSETDDYRISSREAKDVKKKILLDLTNFGKPQIWVEDGNYKNRNELLLVHNYNGVMLDIAEAEKTMKNVFELWGRPVNLKTIVKEGEGEKSGIMLRYDGDEITEETLEWEEVEDIAATEIDYNTKPENWK